MTELWLIRHGETEWNRARRLQGWMDIALNDLGQAQAAALARRLEQEGLSQPFGAVYSSDLGRARNTALPAAGLLGMEVRSEPGVRERGYGVLEGLALDQIEILEPEAGAAWKSREPDRVIPGGETLGQFRQRAIDALAAVAARHAGERVLVFTHGGVLDMVWRHSQGLPLNAPRPELLLNASINRVAVSDTEWRILGWGDISHIGQSADDVVQTGSYTAL